MIDWSDVRYVIATARLGSFHAAALALETNQTTVGRRVARFEAQLGTRIFERHATGMRLTPAGRILYEKAVRMEEAAAELETSVLGLDSRLSGTVRVFAPEGVTSLWLTRILAEFCGAQPAVNVEVVTHRQWQDLFSLDTDIAIFIERPRNPRLVAAKVIKLEYSLFFSRSYQENFGRPNLDKLSEHQFVDYSPYEICKDLSWWTKEVVSKQHVRMVFDSAAAYLSAIRHGVGIGLLPNFYKREAPDLLTLPPPTRCFINLWLVSRSTANRQHRTRILFEYLRERFSKERASWFEG